MYRSVLLACALLSLLSSRSAHAQPAADEQPARPAYQPVGAPADPKVPAQWNRYYDYAQATELLKQLAEAHPERAQLQSLGKSYGGREMWVLSITQFDRGEASEKPAFWIDGGIHANEIQSVEVVLYTAWYLLEMYGRNEMITRLVNERVFYLLPMMSPDSRDAHFYQPHTTHSPRSGQQPFDDDRDGLTDEDGPDDLDGDGHITQMRIRDPHGGHKPHERFPQLMVPVDKDEDEIGGYTLLGSEGFDNDGDGRVNEDGAGYYDPNRNWAWMWQPDYVQNGAGRYPFSIAENRLVARFVRSKPHIAGAQSYHNTGGMILRGPGVKGENYHPRDVDVYQAIGQRGEEMLPGYKSMNVANDLYEVYGGEFDWFHAMRGIYAFTNELFTPFNLFRKAGGGFVAEKEEAHRFDRYLLFGGGTVEWHEVEHPQYGTVEVGGFRKNWLRQPPSFLLEEECHRNMAFTLFHADQLPLVQIDRLTTRELDGGLTEVTAVLVNRRLTPTRSMADSQHKITPPDTVTLASASDDTQVVLAMSDDELLFRQPDIRRRDPQRVELERIPSRGVVYVRWLVSGAGPYTVKFRSVKGGTVSKQTE